MPRRRNLVHIEICHRCCGTKREVLRGNERWLECERCLDAELIGYSDEKKRELTTKSYEKVKKA